MTDFIVPIDYTELKSVIPPDDTILYSDIMKLTAKGTNNTIYKTHVLLTDGGVAYTIIDSKRTTRRGKIDVFNYYPWYEIFNIMGKDIHINWTFGRIYLIQHKETEDKAAFLKRKSEFLHKFVPILLQKKEEWLKTPILSPEGRTPIARHLPREVESGYKITKAQFENFKKKEDKRKLKEEKKNK